MKKLTPPFVFGMALLAVTLGVGNPPDFQAAQSLLPRSAPIARAAEDMNKPLLADRVEKEDSVLYRTDTDPAFSQEEQEKEEKLKEDKSWRMLEHMEIYQKSEKKQPPRQPSTTGQ